MAAPSAPLPIDAVLPDIAAALARQPNAVLVAPPGAGKTTRVPLALLDAPWLAGRRIILLEPRRLAARAAAERMAATLGERVGDTVGLRVRLETKVSRRTRIEVVTEGVFTRLVLDDPGVEGVGAVLFDEFHERSLDADLGLALAIESQGALREDLRLVAMSATLDGARVAALLGDAPVIRSEGRAFPVETRHRDRDPLRRVEDEVVETILKALREEEGSLLVFLPGAGEIRRVASALDEKLRDPAVDIAPLYGALDRGEQDRAIRPAPAGRRKVVLATAIAETSLTIDGVRVVIDSGLARVPVYEPGLGLTRLVTTRVSRAAADQRRGRAGRTAPGICYRLWAEAATGALEDFARPEILAADLAPLLLDCAEWGVSDPASLPFLDRPPAPALAEGRALLRDLGALDADGRITEAGRSLRALPLPPRLARMVLAGAERGAAAEAADLAALLVERGLGGDAVDLADRLDRLRRDGSRRAAETRRMAAGWARIATLPSRGRLGPEVRRGVTPGLRLDDASDERRRVSAPSSPGLLLAQAYPDRIAKARGAPGEYLMANGRAARMEPHLALAREPHLVIAEIAGGAASSRILAAAAIEMAEIEAIAGDRIEEREEIVFDRTARALRARSVRRLGSLILAERPKPVPATPEAAAILARGAASLGLDALPWPDSLRQWRDRVAFLRASEGEEWPDLSDEALTRAVEDWLAPHLVGTPSLDGLSAATLSNALHALLPWPLPRRLDEEAPTHLEVPTGSRIAIDYGAEGGPVLACRPQELFGLGRHPAIAAGRVPLVLHLLSPAGRPIQVTRDLPGFWAGSWAAVRAEMRGRYPKHPWPEDPANAEPTRRAKPRGT
ncbi:ATP-dependent helicase HrpB [Enterovirga rhinocerotis]|uniref:ATP-dependent helicase HrpB n=1 Tax=Enterovirga rhinocerotis TaxID=1339210 RepID=A0A4R7CA80_9HYPH|nr:ATP-dependent helicase HrpB [Enterovirga rhinocerotis]TDR94972.1 ATP-dependent helicase HrpB [Enterovirga rhinocerotis]